MSSNGRRSANDKTVFIIIAGTAVVLTITVLLIVLIATSPGSSADIDDSTADSSFSTTTIDDATVVNAAEGAPSTSPCTCAQSQTFANTVIMSHSLATANMLLNLTAQLQQLRDMLNNLTVVVPPAA